MAAYVELQIDQGSTFQNIINLTDDATNANLNLSNYTVTSRLKKSYYTSTIAANVTCTISDSANGQVTMSITAANTANLSPGRYVFDVKMTDGSGVVSKVLEGIAFVSPGVS